MKRHKAEQILDEISDQVGGDDLASEPLVSEAIGLLGGGEFEGATLELDEFDDTRIGFSGTGSFSANNIGISGGYSSVSVSFSGFAVLKKKVWSIERIEANNAEPC